MAIFAKANFRDAQNPRRAAGQVKILLVAAVVLCFLTVMKTVILRVAHMQADSSAAPPPFPVWAVSGLVRVGQNDPPGTTTAIALAGARGETVDVQVIVKAPLGGLTNVNVSVSELAGPNGATIPPSSLTLYREHYVNVAGTANYGGGSNRPLGSGAYPEPLIPFTDPETNLALCESKAELKACNATIAAGFNQPYWIDISVREGLANNPPGPYQGKVTITADKGNVTIPLTVTVLNFELPPQPSESSLWTLWDPGPGNTIPTLDRALMRNKVMGWYDLPQDAPIDISRFGLSRSGLKLSNKIGARCDNLVPAPETKQVNAVAGNYPAGLSLDFYAGDEINGCSKAYPMLIATGKNVHAANFNVKTLITTNTPDPNLFNEGNGRSAVDHWVLLPSAEQWPPLPFASGGDLWSYSSCNTGSGNTPEWLIDYPPINERIQAGFLNWTQGAIGILYYRADGWTAGNTLASWNNVNTTACGGGLGRPGDGIFVYPPGPIASTEPAPGIRLKAIRDGIQDFEYAQMLKKLGQSDFANSVLIPIAGSWIRWNHEPGALESARTELARQLNQLAPRAPGGPAGVH